VGVDVGEQSVAECMSRALKDLYVGDATHNIAVEIKILWTSNCI